MPVASVGQPRSRSEAIHEGTCVRGRGGRRGGGRLVGAGASGGAELAGLADPGHGVARGHLQRLRGRAGEDVDPRPRRPGRDAAHRRAEPEPRADRGRRGPARLRHHGRGAAGLERGRWLDAGPAVPHGARAVPDVRHPVPLRGAAGFAGPVARRPGRQAHRGRPARRHRRHLRPRLPHDPEDRGPPSSTAPGRSSRRSWKDGPSTRWPPPPACRSRPWRRSTPRGWSAPSR